MESRLSSFPVNFFAVVMGIGGLSLAWRRAHLWWDVPIVIAQSLALLAGILWLIIMATYLAKWARFGAIAKTEARNPMMVPFLSTPTISLLIVGTAFVSIDTAIANIAWWIGTIGHFIMTVSLLAILIFSKNIKFAMLTPAWFIPIVGNVIAPLAINHIGSPEVAWFSFIFGAVAWLVLLPLLMRRAFFFDPPIPTPMTPMLSIFMAPPAVIMLSWQSLTGVDINLVTTVLMIATFVFMAALASQYSRLREAPFAMPYWSYTFPFAAASAATTSFAGMWGNQWALVFAAFVLAFATLLITVVAIRTVPAFIQGKMIVRH